MTDITLEKWVVRVDHASAFVRTFIAEPTTPVEVEYRNDIIKRGVPGDASYLAHVAAAYLHHSWDEKKQAWWSSGEITLRLIDPRTGLPYKTGWKAELVNQLWARQNEAIDVDAIVAPLLEATRPRTTIRVIEEPLP